MLMPIISVEVCNDGTVDASSFGEPRFHAAVVCVVFAGNQVVHNNHHADRFALGTNRDEREQTNGRLSCKIRFEEEVYYNAR